MSDYPHRNTTTEMELKFGLKKSAEHWKQWFEKAGVKPYFTQCASETNQSPIACSTSSPDDNESEYPEHLRPQVKLMRQLVDKHLTLMKDKFK